MAKGANGRSNPVELVPSHCYSPTSYVGLKGPGFRFFTSQAWQDPQEPLQVPFVQTITGSLYIIRGKLVNLLHKSR